MQLNSPEVRTFRRNVNAIMERDGWNNSTLAEAADTSRTAIREIREGTRGVGIDVAAKIARSLGYSLADMFNPRCLDLSQSR